MANGGPLTIGNSYGDTPALITAPIRCESGIVLTDSVWFLNEVPENMTVTPGTILTLDYPGAVANDITLDTFSLRIHDPAVGNGTITVNEGQILRFDTIDLIDGVEVDSPDNPPRTFANNIILNGGELVFTYEEKTGDRMNWSIQPFLLVKVDRKYGTASVLLKTL